MSRPDLSGRDPAEFGLADRYKLTIEIDCLERSLTITNEIDSHGVRQTEEAIALFIALKEKNLATEIVARAPWPEHN